MKEDENTSLRLISEIEKETRIRIEQINQQANIQAQQIVLDAKKQAERIIKEEKEKTLQMISVMRQRAEATLKMEIRKMQFELKKRFADSVIEKVKELAWSLRQDSEYKRFLKKAIIEGIMVIDSPQMVVRFSPEDREIFNPDLENKIREECKKNLKRNVSLSFVEDDFQDVGVIVCSADGFVMYENTFSARLKRMYEIIYSELLSEGING